MTLSSDNDKSVHTFLHSSLSFALYHVSVLFKTEVYIDD